MARTEDKIIFTPGEKFLLKDHLFNKKKIQRLAAEIKQTYPDFDAKKFITLVVIKFPELELKARIEHITDILYTILPQNYPQALEIILDALPPALDANKIDDDFGEFLYEPFNTFVARYGCNDTYFTKSLSSLAQTTQRFSAEFALRSFIVFNEDKTLVQVAKWSRDKNYHIRRLSSEGIRPNLPWGGKIQTDPSKIIAILDNLFYDKTRYVVRSVANNLNDISKIDYALVLRTLKRWKKEDKQNGKEFEYLVRHALRSQIKSGEPDVMKFLGYKPDVQYDVTDIQYKKQINVGDKQEINFTLTAQESGKFMIDYVVFFRKKDGQLSGKTFKIKDVYLKKGESLSIDKKHLFRIMSTKQLYSGEHAWCLQVNGAQNEKYSFDLGS